ncbi:MAG: hypothetical protein QXJ07_03255 [Candidatus Bathyarchaeia archaeon]
MKWYWWLLTAIFVIFGLTTLIPAPASKPNLLSYYTHCSFTPVSTIICWIIASIFLWLGKRKA